MCRVVLLSLVGLLGCSAPPPLPSSGPTKIDVKPPATTPSASAAAAVASVAAIAEPVCPPCSAPTPTCSRGVCVSPTSLGTAFSVAAIFSDGTARLIGENSLGSEFAENAREVESSSDRKCVLTSTSGVRCYDASKKRFTDVPGFEDATHIVMKNYDVCASRARGDIVCSTADAGDRKTNEPTVILAKLSSPVVQLAGSDHHACARLENGNVLCWGSNGHAECGTKKYEVDETNSLFVREPTLVADLKGAVDIALMVFSSCAVLSNGTAVCWGSAIGNEINDRAAVDAMLAQPMTRADQLALEATPRWQFYRNVFKKPQSIPGVKDATKLVFGLRRLWILHKDGTISSVNPDELTSKRPNVEKLAGVTDVVQIASGYEDVCALTSKSEIHCWQEADLGADKPSPVTVRKILLDGKK